MTQVSDGQEFIEFLELSPFAQMVTKSELLDFVRKRGGPISDRQLTYYTTEGLIPKSIRVGSRAGVYPASVQWMLAWIVRQRKRNLAIEAIRELLPAWRYLYRAFNTDRVVDLAVFEEKVREHVRSTEAAYAVPQLVQEITRCDHCRAKTRFVDKNGHDIEHDADHPIVLGFVMADYDKDDDQAKVAASTRLVLASGVSSDQPTTIIVGAPNDIPVVDSLDSDETEDREGPHLDEAEVEEDEGG